MTFHPFWEMVLAATIQGYNGNGTLDKPSLIDSISLAVGVRVDFPILGRIQRNTAVRVSVSLAKTFLEKRLMNQSQDVGRWKIIRLDRASLGSSKPMAGIRKCVVVKFLDELKLFLGLFHLVAEGR